MICVAYMPKWDVLYKHIKRFLIEFRENDEFRIGLGITNLG